MVIPLGFLRLPEGCLWKEDSNGTTAISQLYMNRPKQEIPLVMLANSISSRPFTTMALLHGKLSCSVIANTTTP
jgi:hypothetical protein